MTIIHTTLIIINDICRLGKLPPDDICVALAFDSWTTRRLGIKRVNSLRFDPTEAFKTSTLTITLPMQLKIIFGISAKTKTHSLVFQRESDWTIMQLFYFWGHNILW